MKKILVTGAFGLVGSDLVPVLQKKFGSASVFALGNKTIPGDFKGQLVTGDVRQKETLEKLSHQKKLTMCIT